MNKGASPDRKKNAPVPVIAIDGPAAAGKGTVAAKVAAALGFHLLESGRLYRALALFALRRGLDLDDEAALAQAAAFLAASPAALKKVLAAPEIEGAATGEAASAISKFPAVRAGLLDLQRRARRAPGLVAEGRDMGSVVFPDADLKIYLSPPARIRARRRALQLRAAGRDVKIADVYADLRRRDIRDRERANAPLRRARGARRFSNGAMSAAATASQIAAFYAGGESTA